MDNRCGNMKDGYLQMKQKELNEDMEKLESKMKEHNTEIQSLYKKITDKLDKYYDLMKPLLDSIDLITEYKNSIEEIFDRKIIEKVNEGVAQITNNAKETFNQAVEFLEKKNNNFLSDISNQFSKSYDENWIKINDEIKSYFELNQMNHQAIINEICEKTNITLDKGIKLTDKQALKKAKKEGLIN